jgi:hypothetical protein
MLRDVLPECAADLAAGRVAGVEDAADRVRRLASERGLAVLITIEGGTPLDELAYVSRPVRDEHVHGGLYAQAVASRDRVSTVQFRGIIGPDGGSDATLGVSGVALARVRLRQDDHGAGRCKRDGGAEAGDAAADDQEIATHRHGLLSYQASMHNAQRTMLKCTIRSSEIWVCD